MAERIRRDSMEHLELYDLDQITILKSNKQIPPPLPPPREQQHHLPPNFAFERYQFLCDMTRNKEDPVYAATPMFKTIPHSTPVKHCRQLLGSRIPSKIVTPISITSPMSPTSLKSPEPESARIDNDTKEEQEEESSDEDEDENSDNDDNGSDENEDDSSSSEDNNDNDDILNDDRDNRGIVETIFNRHKK